MHFEKRPADRREPHPERLDYGSYVFFERPRRQHVGAAGGPRPTASCQVMSALLTDEATFSELAERHRRELHVHCYRMLASFDEAEDAVQETLLRAWRARDTFEGEHLARAWLYRIATNVCLDMLRSKSRRVQELQSFAEVSWLTPYPDRLLDELASDEDEPDAVAVARETIELAFLAALQVLPPRQRAALLLRDVLGMPAAETAALLETSVPAANSALQRARAMMQKHLAVASHRSGRRRSHRLQERALLERFIDAHERYDAKAALAAVTDDIRVTMPPMPMCFDGVEAHQAVAAKGVRPRARWRMAARPDHGQPDAGCRELPQARRATPSTEPSSSTCSGSRATGSPRSRRSVHALFDSFDLPMILPPRD